MNANVTVIAVVIIYLLVMLAIGYYSSKKITSNEDFMVIHRIAIAPDHLEKGLVQTMLTYIEELAKEQHIYSLRADTNFDNAAMLHLLQKMGYHYCGEVMMRGGKRKAFEKYSG